MTDQLKLDRMRTMYSQIGRALAADEPDMRVVKALLSDALQLAMDMTDPPDPYADKTLRPGLNTVGEAAAAGMIAPPQGG